MAYTIGRCTNDMYCAAASSQHNLQIPVGAQFVCPQCGKKLAAPRMEKRSVSSPALLVYLGLVLAGAALFAAGATIGKNGPQPVTPPIDTAVVRETAPSSPPAELKAGVAVSPPVQRPMPLRANMATIAPAALARVTAPAFHLATIQTPARQAAPAPMQQMAIAPPSAAQSQARGQAAAARRARLDEQAGREKATQQKAAEKAAELRRKGEQKKIKAASAALAREQAEAALAIRAQIQAQVLAKQHRDEEAKRLAGVPPAPRGTTRGFSPSAIAGGAPAYPQDYENEGRIGRVTVSCLIGQTGTPSGCHVLAAQGGVGFSNAALGWLRSGSVRFAPVLRGGEAQAGEHSWTMAFEP